MLGGAKVSLFAENTIAILAYYNAFPYICRSNVNPITFAAMRYSLIIPVFNRPDEVAELLQSLASQTFRDFEVVVVEDGSSVPCREVVERYAGMLDVHYYAKPNSGPGQTRNYGAERSRGDYLIILDSDVILPPGTSMRWSRNCGATLPMLSAGPTVHIPRSPPCRKPSTTP